MDNKAASASSEKLAGAQTPGGIYQPTPVNPFAGGSPAQGYQQPYDPGYSQPAMEMGSQQQGYAR
jgi:hypothetical protein